MKKKKEPEVHKIEDSVILWAEPAKEIIISRLPELGLAKVKDGFYECGIIKVYHNLEPWCFELSVMVLGNMMKTICTIALTGITEPHQRAEAMITELKKVIKELVPIKF